jgi:hypothetical protein
MLSLLLFVQLGHGMSIVAESSMFFMGASFRLQFGGEKLNCTRLDAPAISTLGAA